MGGRDVAPQVGDGKDILSILRGCPSSVYTFSKSDCNDDSQGKYGFRGRGSSSGGRASRPDKVSNCIALILVQSLMAPPVLLFSPDMIPLL